MKRMHVHVGVENLAESISFYTALFGAKPAKLKPDYAKWMLDDPHLNFAISTRSGRVGVNHMGLQVDDEAELAGLRDQLSAANISTHSDGQTICCYARSEKSWVEDPNGVAWEAYHTMADAQIYAGGDPVGPDREASAHAPAATPPSCCAPTAAPPPSCCAPTAQTAANAACCAEPAE